MDEPTLRRTQRHLPHWVSAGRTYFITFRLKGGELTDAERQIVFDHVRSGDPSYYRLFACVVMPDHVHLLVRPGVGIGLSRMMKGIKGVSSRKVNTHRQMTGRNACPTMTGGDVCLGGTGIPACHPPKAGGTLWQDESYDRIVRDAEEGQEKARYIHTNPVRAGLVNDPKDYSFLYLNDIT